MRNGHVSGIAVGLFAALALVWTGAAGAQDKTKKDSKGEKKTEPAGKSDKKDKAAAEEEVEEVEEEEEDAAESQAAKTAADDKAKADYEEEPGEEAEIEEESEEVEEAEEGDVEEEGDEEAVEEEEAPKPPKPKKERAPLPEIPPVGVPIAEGKWVNLYLTSSIVSYYRLALQNLSGPAGTDMTLNHSFVANWIYLGFFGNFWNGRILFDVKGDLAEFITPNQWDDQLDSSDANSFLLDASVSVKPLLGVVPDDFSDFAIKFGRFIPDFGYYHTRNVGLLDVAEYPLIASSMMPFRQVGLELLYSHKYFEVVLGVFNGMRFQQAGAGGSSIWMAPGFDGANSANVVDDNKAKDFLVRVTGKIPIGLRVDAWFWLSRPEFHLATGAHAVTPVFVYGGEAVYENLFDNFIRLKLVAGFNGRTLTYPEDSATGDPVFDSFTQMGILFHAGLRVGQWVEPVVRIEMWNGRAVETAPGVFEGQDPFGQPVPGRTTRDGGAVPADLALLLSHFGMASGATWDLWATFGLNGFLFGDHMRLSVLGTYIRRSNQALGDDFWLTGQVALVL